ncbi:GNAT family N-acetyltransferase [Bacillus sp. 31A1R]|uniref:GNAT family N-acetyltransferase n=1 Tax=Robertmurraya mangrovi TaxID=3098077 RepID=A0ABU5IYE0_9BACI|nr:GNAT family N-acetyltransferase [Bacillus sp. 31A1R]MDZ5472178.1 GNAT family N-acetyltransferase [Bacillus sp. 31A1R]
MELVAVQSEKKSVLANLLEYYVYEFSPYLHIDVNEEGKYGFDKVEEYVESEQYSSYFIMVENQYAGFVIVKIEKDGPFNYSIEQFFVLNRYNGKGIGKKAAIEIFNRYRGKWQITQTETNYHAQAFWRGVIKGYTKNEFIEKYDEKRRSVQLFTN